MSFHASAIEILVLIASYEAQKEYEKNVPIADVPSELVCIWFDDFYNRTPQFEKDFTEKELEMLSEFNSFFDDRVDRLPDSREGLEKLQKSKLWKEISEKAGSILLKLRRKNV